MFSPCPFAVANEHLGVGRPFPPAFDLHIVLSSARDRIRFQGLVGAFCFTRRCENSMGFPEPPWASFRGPLPSLEFPDHEQKGFPAQIEAQAQLADAMIPHVSRPHLHLHLSLSLH